MSKFDHFFEEEGLKQHIHVCEENSNQKGLFKDLEDCILDGFKHLSELFQPQETRNNVSNVQEGVEERIFPKVNVLFSFHCHCEYEEREGEGEDEKGGDNIDSTNRKYMFGFVDDGGEFQGLEKEKFLECLKNVNEGLLKISPELKGEVVYVGYRACYGIKLVGWFTDVMRKLQYIGYYPKKYLQLAQYPKNLIGLLDVYQKMAIGPCVKDFASKHPLKKNEILKIFKQEVSQLRESQNEKFIMYEKADKNFMEKCPLLSKWMFWDFLIDLICQFEETLGFKRLHNKNFVECLPNRSAIREYSEGIYCMNDNGDCYCMMYKDIKQRRRVIVVDGGSIGSFKRTYWNFISKINKIDLLVLTHRDDDHVGCFAMFLKGYVKYVMNNQIPQGKHYPQVEKILYRRKFLDFENAPPQEAKQGWDERKCKLWEKEYYRHLLTKSIMDKLEGKVIDPDKLDSLDEQFLDDMNVFILRRENYYAYKDGVSKENRTSLSFIADHYRSKGSSPRRCCFSGDVQEQTVVSQIKELLKDSPLYFADLPHHGSEHCCKVSGGFLDLNVKVLVCTNFSKNQNTPHSEILANLRRKTDSYYFGGKGIVNGNKESLIKVVYIDFLK